MTKELKKLLADAMEKHNECWAHRAKGDLKGFEELKSQANGLLTQASRVYFASSESDKEIDKILKAGEGKTGKKKDLAMGLDFVQREDDTNNIVLWVVFKDVYGKDCAYWRTFPDDDIKEQIAKRLSEPIAEGQNIILISSSVLPASSPAGIMARTIVLVKKNGQWEQYGEPRCFCNVSLEEIKNPNYWEEKEEDECDCDECERREECLADPGDYCLLDEEDGYWEEGEEDEDWEDEEEEPTCEGCDKYENCKIRPKD